MFKTINGGILPKRFSKYSSGFDVYANEDVIIGAGETKLVGLGIAIDSDLVYYYSTLPIGEVPKETKDNCAKSFYRHHYFELNIRSSLRVKGLTSLGTGIIDIDYPDEIKMVVHNPFNPYISAGADCVPIIETTPYTIRKGDKIGQLILKRHEGYLLPSEYTLDNERVGGFGSTNTKDN